MTEGENSFQPIRTIKPDGKFVHKNDPGRRSKKKIFVGENEFKELQVKLEKDIENIALDLKDSFIKYPKIPSVIKAKLRDKALAKSHRPDAILNSQTCPIIGVDDFGELLLGSTNNGLQKLKLKIAESYNDEQKANVSALENLSTYSSEDKLLGLSISELIEKSRRNNSNYIKIILFDHHDPDVNWHVNNSFQELINNLGLKAENLSNIESLRILRIVVLNPEQINKIISHPSVRVASFFPPFKIVLPKTALTDRMKISYPVPIREKEYPIVAVVDSGISRNNPYLAPWIIDSETYVPTQYENREHGTFVAGLVCMADRLNNGICEDTEQIQLIDVHIIPDSSKETIYEDDLIQRLSESVPRILSKHKSKIWNMSLGLSRVADDQSFSSLSVFLDKLQDEYDIIFLVPSGNYTSINQRRWPPQSEIGNADRLQVPGDSVRAVTVGAIACTELPGSLVKKDQPASYSCRGPGPSYIVKPELVHYSGNISINGRGLDEENQGIKSFDEKGNIIEGAGTSFSTPLVARSLSILNQTLDDSASNSLLRALIVHNSYPPKDLDNVGTSLHYIGFGKPSGAKDFLTCNNSAITLVFDHEITNGHTVYYPFYWPESLIDQNGKCRGRVRITLAAKLPLDSDFGSEYIRANISASLQSYNSVRDEWTNKLSEYPVDFNPSEFYESKLVQQGFKWKPIKRYEADLKRVSSDDWRIKVNLLLRSGYDLNGEAIQFALVFTLSDQENAAPVYNEVVLGLQQLGIVSEPIQIRSRFQTRLGS